MRILTYLVFGFLAVTNILSCGGSVHRTPSKNAAGQEAPVLVKNVTPDYPVFAKEAGVTGTVWIKALVDSNGIVRDAVVLRDLGENISFFEKSAIDAALKCKWKPAKENGDPIAVWVTYKVDFGVK